MMVVILMTLCLLGGKQILTSFSRPSSSLSIANLKMGATPGVNGTQFRVWAPHAARVSVTGSFNQWSEDPLSLEGDGIWVGEVSAAQVGDQYRYVIVNRETGKTYLRIDPYAKQVTHSMGYGIITDSAFDWGSTSDFRPPPLSEMVIYEIHVGTFWDQPGGAPGTLYGVKGKLDYLQDLGINAIKILPIMEFAGDYSWGYNPSLIYAVESAYGGQKAFKELVKAAHEKGIAVILDIVYNHFGPSDLDLWQFDGWSPHPDTGGIYFYNNWRARTHWAHTRPNFRIPQVRKYLADNAIMLLDEFKVDGLRWDSTVNMRTVDNGQGARLPDGITLMQELNDVTHSFDPPRISIAEDHRDNPQITQDTQSGGLGFDAQWDPKFVHPIREAIINPADQNRNLSRMAWAIRRRYSKDAFERVIYTESHDEVANGSARVPEDIWLFHADSWPAQKRSTLGAAIVFTSPGIPMIFQGQEMLEDRWFQDDDPLDWSKLDRFSGIHDLYRDLISLRRNLTGTTRGLSGQNLEIHHLDHQNKIMAYHRWDKGGPQDDVIVVLNMTRKSYSAYPIGFPRSGTWRVRLNTDWNRYSSDFGNYPSPDVMTVETMTDNMPHTGYVGLGPWTALILSQDS
jgi:1,4-alpha-glucan branching enzyme